MADAASFARELSNDQVQILLRTLNDVVAADSNAQAVCVDFENAAIVVMLQPGGAIGRDTKSAADDLSARVRVDVRRSSSSAEDLHKAKSTVRSRVEARRGRSSSADMSVSIGIDWLHGQIRVRTSDPIDADDLSGPAGVPVAVDHVPSLRRRPAR